MFLIFVSFKILGTGEKGPAVISGSDSTTGRNVRSHTRLTRSSRGRSFQGPKGQILTEEEILAKLPDRPIAQRLTALEEKVGQSSNILLAELRDLKQFLCHCFMSLLVELPCNGSAPPDIANSTALRDRLRRFVDRVGTACNCMR